MPGPLMGASTATTALADALITAREDRVRNPRPVSMAGALMGVNTITAVLATALTGVGLMPKALCSSAAENSLDSSEAGSSSSSAALVGQSPAAQAGSDMQDAYDAINDLYQVMPHNPLKTLAGAIQGLKELIEQDDGKEAQRRFMEPNDLGRIKSELAELHNVIEFRALSYCWNHDGLTQKAFFEAGVSYGVLEECSYKVLQHLYGVERLWAHVNADCNLAALQARRVESLALGLYCEERLNQRAVMIMEALHRPYPTDFRYRAGEPRLIPDSETELREKWARQLRRVIGAELMQWQVAREWSAPRAFEEIRASLFVRALRTALDDDEQTTVDGIAKAICPAALLTEAAAQDLRPSQSPPILAHILCHVGVLGRWTRWTAEQLFWREVELVRDVLSMLQFHREVLQNSAPQGDQEPPPLPILLLRHVVLEHTLLLLRRHLAHIDGEPTCT